MRKILFLVLTFMLALSPMVFAETSSQISVTVSITQTVAITVTPDNYAFGSSNAGWTVNTAVDAFTATNTGNGLEKFTILVGNSANWTAGVWAAGVGMGKDKFQMGFKTETNSGTIIMPATGSTLVNNLAKNGVQKFGLEIILPSDTDYAGVQQTIPVTITASVAD